ncbi:MAG TPA: hypothetical protein VFG14_01840, partial [Chthoniobacteraceae bacterium]|nr:hypothetical protein [Chthoniobacteraceae bacterium]
EVIVEWEEVTVLEVNGSGVCQNDGELDETRAAVAALVIGERLILENDGGFSCIGAGGHQLTTNLIKGEDRRDQGQDHRDDGEGMHRR